MPTNECVELYPAGGRVTGRATTDILGKRFVKATTNTRTGGLISVGQCTAAAKSFGVAAKDALTGENVGVFGTGFIVPVTCGGTVAAGTEVESDSTGRAVTLASGRPNGYCVVGAASGADAQIRIY